MSTLLRTRRQLRHAPIGTTMFRRSMMIFPFIAALSLLWAFASPLMSVPDEPAHTIKAVSVAQGQLRGTTGNNQGDLTLVQVPYYIAAIGQQACMGMKPTVTADCAPPVNGDASEKVDAVTSAGNYNPVYYVIVGSPSRFLSGESAIYAMRAVSALLGACFLSLAIAAAASMRRPFWPTTAALVAVTPMVLYLNASINPNALEIVTTASLFLSMCLVFENHKQLSSARFAMVVVGISGAILANTRALSLIWLTAAVVAAVIIYGFQPLLAVVKNRLGQTMMGLIALGCLASLAWLAVANSFKSLGGIPSEVTPDQAFFTMLDRTFSYSSGYIGIIGWLDTPAPGAVITFWSFAFATLILGGLSMSRGRGRIAVCLILLAVILLPPILQSQVITELGYIWQGRYLLALFVLLVLTCGIILRERPAPQGEWAQSVGRWFIAGAIGAHIYMFIYALRRYTVGIQQQTNWTEMFDSVWQPPLSWQVLALAYLLVLLMGGVLAYKMLLSRSTVTIENLAGSADLGDSIPDARDRRH
ncbi:DUF2142 domain-containing protein [Specibacter sp. NPDC057265]|uniref:DUF2142 domain-containing protein n=1 Tax=Specibacter sp. NPDC057265 TaxID=3346075 RepID=UPI003625032D